jgi:hypothetical protein
MTVRPYPSNTIILDIDEGFLDRNLKLALERSWAHVGETLVRTHVSPEDSGPYNAIRVLVKYGTRRYLWSTDGEEADANWEERMEKHIANTIHKVGNCNKAFNRNQKKAEEKEVSYDHIVFELESGALSLQFRLDSNSDVPVECARIATEIRKTLNEQGQGEGLKRIIAPSAASYRQQESAFSEAIAEREAKRAAEEQAARRAAEEALRTAESEAEELFLESPELIRQSEEKQDSGQSREEAEVAPLTAEEWETEYGFDEADFEIDYHIWEFVYEDGSSRLYDSSTAAFIVPSRV